MERTQQQIDQIPKPQIPNMNNANPIFGGRLSGKLERGPFDRNKWKKNRRIPNIPEHMNELPDFGKMNNMLNRGPYSDMGEGPIFNGLNGKNPKNELSPLEVKQKLKNARARFNAQNAHGRQFRFDPREEM